MIKYFVTYTYKSMGSDIRKYGRIDIDKTEPITSGASLVDIEKVIRRDIGGEIFSLLITNWKRYETNE